VQRCCSAAESGEPVLVFTLHATLVRSVLLSVAYQCCQRGDALAGVVDAVCSRYCVPSQFEPVVVLVLRKIATVFSHCRVL
jgi:hypothetical protein